MKNSQKIIWTVAFLSFLVVVMVIGYEMAVLHDKTKKHELKKVEQHEGHSTGPVGSGKEHFVYWDNYLILPMNKV